jgi:hypothetical protein
MSSDKRMKPCCDEILADDQEERFHIWLKKFTSGKKRSEDIKNQHHSFSMKEFNSKEWTLHFDFKVCGPEVEFFPVQGAAGGCEAALNDEGAGGKCELNYRDGH